MFAIQKKLAEEAEKERPLPPLFEAGAFGSVSRAKRRWIRAAASLIAMNRVCSALGDEPDEELAHAMQGLRAILTAFVDRRDERGDGVSRDDVEHVLEELGIRIAAAQVDRLVITDECGDALVNWRDLFGMVGAYFVHVRRGGVEREYREAFEILSDGTPFVRRERLLQCMKHLGAVSPAAPAAEGKDAVDKLIEEADRDADGRVSLDDFAWIMQQASRSGSVL